MTGQGAGSVVRARTPSAALRDGELVERVLASFVSPARVDVLVRDAVAGSQGDPLVAAVVLVRRRYGIDPPVLAAALDDAGVSAGGIARVLGSDLVTVNRWLDDDSAVLPRFAREPWSSNRLRSAGVAVWTLGPLLAVAWLAIQLVGR